MALTQVRAKLAGVWTVLTYNSATGRYEGTLTPPGTSIHQPGGYYDVTVEATNATGQVATLTGAQYAGLRLVVRETAAPTLELLSPPQGWLTTSRAVFTFSAQDEAGGSGIDPASAQATIDGAEVPCTVTESGGVYQLTFAGQALSEGPHLVTAAISDRDGNRTAASAAYQVDTVPPVITVLSPDLHRVVDWSKVEVSGYVRDETSGVASVTVDGVEVWPHPSQPSAVPPSPLGEGLGDGRFSCVVPLEVGVNEITVSAADGAGLRSTQTLWMLRLITDRTQADADRLNALLDKVRAGYAWDDFTPEEQTYWQGVVRGAYNSDDLNRVGVAVDYIAGYLRRVGYAPDVEPKTDWTEADAPSPDQRQTYLDNVAALKALLPLQEPEVPPDMEGFHFTEANDIETILVNADRLFPLMERSVIYSGEGFAGEF